jgi:hypothetical protein
VIYDAAHAFGVRRRGESSCAGDLSILSFHATKVFNTFEGGAIVCPDAKTKQRIDHLKNFGFVDEVTVVAPGINGKMNEVKAAFGLLQLKHIDAALRPAPPSTGATGGPGGHPDPDAAATARRHRLEPRLLPGAGVRGAPHQPGLLPERLKATTSTRGAISTR